jgi:hypothetical protein
MKTLLPCRSAALIALAAGLLGCESTAPDQVVLPISDLTVPATITQGELLVAKVTVHLGGCRSFDRIVMTRSPGQVTFRAIGLDGSGPNVLCPADVRSEVVEFHPEGPFSDPLLLVGVQPSGEETRRTVRVFQ